VLAAAEHEMDRHGGPVWDDQGFDRLRAAVGAGLEPAARQMLADAVAVLSAWRDVDRALSGTVDMALLPAMADMRSQVGRLVHRGFVADAGPSQLRHLPRYLAAVGVRRERLAADPARDRSLMDQVLPLQAAYLHRRDALPEGQAEPAALRRVRWLLEELRVSLWAQQLRTAEPVSEARVRKALAQV
jgi:ATP-dependent helicase HrpA